MKSPLISLSTPALELAFQVNQDQFLVRRYGTPAHSWLHPQLSPRLFAVYIQGERFDALNMKCLGLEEKPADSIPSRAAGSQHTIARFSALDFQLDCHLVVYEETALIEMWQVLRSLSQFPLHVTRLDSFSWAIPDDAYELLHYSSDWGQEFEPVRELLSGPATLETRFGRSSKGQHPWFALFSSTGSVLSGSVAWSGNWIIRFEPLAAGSYRLSGGLHDWNFAKDLLPGQVMESPHGILVLGDNLNTVSQQYARVGRRYWYPHNAPSDQLPVEWNHWFSYEDAAINEAVFRANVSAAAEMGVEACVLDAGWFGPDGLETAWHRYRGDWDQVNRARFPRGIPALSEDAHRRGMLFGLWCEIEGLGDKAYLAEIRPELAAARDGERSGYVCFGSPQTQEWAYDTLYRLISEYHCDWIKLDFNVDPGAGCNRTDHGHGAGDGLYEHYLGYYRTLERIRQTFPHVILENCSSGGLRIDLGMLRRTHMTFLSDPDWPVHDLQIFWGASTLLAPETCLHWSFCEWGGSSHHPRQTFNPRDPDLKLHQLDYYTRISMLGWCGFSQKLPDLPAWVRDRLAYHTRVYRDHVRRFVREADLYRLTDQPRRDGGGDRWSAFQYMMPDQAEHLLFVFRLPGGEAERVVRLFDLNPNRLYRIEGFEGEKNGAADGRSLMKNGITFKDLSEEGSALLRVF